ncbi:MAG TPA: hypothetical protein PLD59_16975, partial [Tepidisphaeraceae bacterium]|nr:hypothetical protein [Tepidisphaeraceae bacterium]
MSTAKTKLRLSVLLPDVVDERDACVERLRALMTDEQGITQAHIGDADGINAQFCLHYDPDRTSLARVQTAVRAAGARISDQFGHATIKIRMIDAEDGARKLEM